MDTRTLINFMSVVEKLKCNTRHSFTSSGRRESVAEHSWQLALLAFLVKNEFPGVDINKVILMALVHDLGEVVTGDIPSFDKTQEDEEREYKSLFKLLDPLPQELKTTIGNLIVEMEDMETLEAKLIRGLDKMECVMQHNAADISTWEEKEYQLVQEYGAQDVEFSRYLSILKEMLNEDSKKKIREHKEKL